MVVTFTIFLISLASIGILVGRRLASPSQQASSFPTSIWYHLHVPTLQHHIWSTILFVSRYILVITVIRGLLFIERSSRGLAQRLHTLIEKTMKYHHTHH